MKTSHVTYRTGRGPRSSEFKEVNRSEVARKLGVSRSHISRILSGNVDPSVEVLDKLSRLLRISMGQLNVELKRVRNKGVPLVFRPDPPVEN